MNIFVLDTDPKIAASYHCDQHLNKMILESAQMACAVLKYKYPTWAAPYKETHANHPCTLWLKQSNANLAWLFQLARNLDNIRQAVRNTMKHSSMDVLEVCEAFLLPEEDTSAWPHPENFVFAGPPSIEIRNLTVPEKYQMYYRQKYRQWLDTRAPMSYKNRPIPPFMADLF